MSVLAFPVTTALIIVNAVVFLLEESWGGSTTTMTLFRMGAVVSWAYREFEPASMLAYAYLHIGFVHVAVNMYSLWNLGRALEPMLGSARFFVLYTVSALGGGVAIALASTRGVTAGASGALFGLMGAVAAILYLRHRASRFEPERAAIRKSVLQLMLPNLLISLMPGVSLLGHAGGLVAGGAFMGLVAVLARGRSSRPFQDRRFDVAAVICTLVTLFSVGWSWFVHTPWDPLTRG